MVNPFDIAKHITTKDAFEFDVKDYPAFMTNRILSYNIHTIHFSHAMSKMSCLDKDIQYDFYMRAIPKGKKFFEYKKSTPDSELVKMLMHKYSCNVAVAEQYAGLLTEDQKTIISESKGGRNGTR